MTDKTLLSVDGVPSDGVGHALATSDQLDRFKEANEELSRFRAPILVDANNDHEKLFIAAFDGTGNNKFSDPLHATNVAKISDQLELAMRAGNKQIHALYVVGPGTQTNKLTAALDGITGFSYSENINDAYTQFVDVADAWKQADPEAVIRLQSIGFSRGASQAAGFARLVHEKGIPDLNSETVNAEGEITYSRYHVAPGKVVQTIGLFDPVATGVPMDFDRRLPPSVVSGFQITAADERRALFPSDQLMPPGLSEDGRFLNVMVPGAHSDVGGGYLRNGLSTRCGNLMIDYCNSARDVPFLHKQYEPTDPRLNVIHRSTEGMAIYRLDPREVVRGEPSGTNLRQAPADHIQAGPIPHHAEAFDITLTEKLTHRPIPLGHKPLIPDSLPNPAATPEAILEAGRSAPFVPKAGRVLGAAAIGVDVAHTSGKTLDLHKHGNEAGVRSEILHFAGRNMGAWAGAETFATLGAAAGVESGPGLVVTTAVGGLAGFAAGDKLMDAYDHYRVYQQADPQGNTWHYDPAHPNKGWTRDIPPLPDTPHGQRLVADVALASRLTYQASSTAAELAIARAQPPLDPYSQPALPGDTPSLREAPWTRDPATHQWSRHVTDQVLEHGLTSAHTEVAHSSRAAQLDRAAEQTVRDNVEQSPEGIARHYQTAYAQEDWVRHGRTPKAITDALNVPEHQLAASDGHTYTRSNDGQWSRPGMLYGTNPADARTREELDASERITLAARHEAAPSTMAQAKPASAPPQRLDDPAHPDHAFFQQVRGHVERLDQTLGRTPDHHTDKLASALTVQARADGLQRIDQIALSEDGTRLWAIQASPGDRHHLFDLRTKVPTAEANTPMEQSAAQWPQAMQQFQETQAQTQSQARTMQDMQAQAMQGPGMAR